MSTSKNYKNKVLSIPSFKEDMRNIYSSKVKSEYISGNMPASQCVMFLSEITISFTPEEAMVIVSSWKRELAEAT